ncbi:hypothetical protein HM1_1011 [Heliomicrobium modesticaldum Ice1]|uniref:Uncharacterized protein n=2 Tax=Heliomicrobium modesticaldum TaxID=35701 RepID=B0TIE3_HELMI|nr:hypothetical protein HM1_1011 [Heliomicrobium modesticaldum Ice1]
MIEKNFDITFISKLAMNEKQIQQNYRHDFEAFARIRA